MAERLTAPQKRALACLSASYGEAFEYTLWMEGLNFPRVTMRALERRGLVVRGEYREDYGYIWRLARLEAEANHAG